MAFSPPDETLFLFLARVGSFLLKPQHDRRAIDNRGEPNAMQRVSDAINHHAPELSRAVMRHFRDDHAAKPDDRPARDMDVMLLNLAHAETRMARDDHDMAKVAKGGILAVRDGIDKLVHLFLRLCFS